MRLFALMVDLLTHCLMRSRAARVGYCGTGEIAPGIRVYLSETVGSMSAVIFYHIYQTMVRQTIRVMNLCPEFEVIIVKSIQYSICRPICE